MKSAAASTPLGTARACTGEGFTYSTAARPMRRAAPSGRISAGRRKQSQRRRKKADEEAHAARDRDRPGVFAVATGKRNQTQPCADFSGEGGGGGGEDTSEGENQDEGHAGWNSQFSTSRPGTREKWPTLLVTNTQSLASAMSAMRMSPSPITWP